ncbi:MAG: NAD(P)-dependent oxidoreductase [Candidatus Acidiferrales bacterium]
MKIALIGGTGYVGSKILAEALRRGHNVTAIERHPQRLTPRRNLRIKKADVLHRDPLARILARHDVIISAFNPRRGTPGPEIYHRHVRGHRAIIAAAKRSGVKRFLAVGGAASLKTPAGVEFIDSPEFPAAYEPFKPGIRGTRELYYLLKKESGLDWVFLAPSVMIAPGARTGKYRVGKDHVLYDDAGKSRISLQDYAVAMLDELEHPKHHRERFTVGY